MTHTSSIKVDPLTCALGAELSGVDLGAASRDETNDFWPAVRKLERAGIIGDRPISSD